MTSEACGRASVAVVTGAHVVSRGLRTCAHVCVCVCAVEMSSSFGTKTSVGGDEAKQQTKTTRSATVNTCAACVCVCLHTRTRYLHICDAAMFFSRQVDCLRLKRRPNSRPPSSFFPPSTSRCLTRASRAAISFCRTPCVSKHALSDCHIML